MAEGKPVGGPPQIDPSEIQLGRKLGEGCFGVVYVGRCRQTDVAVKIPKKQDQITQDRIESFNREVEIMSNIFAPNIALFMGASTKPGNIMIVTELLSGNLEELLHDPTKELSYATRMQMARDAALGVAWLHGSNPIIIHRDLKSSNFLFDKNHRIKVCDFGLSDLFERGKKLYDDEGAKGTPLYMAPEVMLGEEFNEKADVYSFGIVLWEILTRKEPFSQYSDYDIFVAAICDEGVRPPIPDDCIPSLRKLMTDCWDANPKKRPDFVDIVKRLDEIIIEYAIEDPEGRAMWKKHFSRKEQISWRNEFLPAFCKAVGVPPVSKEEDEKKPSLPFACLRAVLADKGKDNNLTVDVEKFGRVLGWFGPLRNLLTTITNVLRQPWFFGYIEYNDADHRLANKQPGTFLVRFSSNSSPCCFAISKVNSQGKTVHLRIQHKFAGDFTLPENHKSDSLIGLIEACKGPVNLKFACPDSPYLHLFNQSSAPEVDNLYAETSSDDYK